MATVRTAFVLQDRVTQPLQNITRAMDIVINSFDAMQTASGNSVDVSAIQQAREELARAEVVLNDIEQNADEAGDAQRRFNDQIRDGTTAADSLGGKLKGILATVISIAGVKSALGWVKENLELADTQRNAENQLQAVLANMGSTTVEVPVDVNYTGAAEGATQVISSFDAIKDKASEIQSMGIYGDEAMIAGAAELATYFTDAEAIMSMMDTLSDYAMGMTGGGEIDSTAMVDYATNLGKIMSGAYDAMTKKGFEFTDAQKAIIEGTATEAQYVEALGADYLSMSEDMRAATVINDIIAESWDGLYETMSNTPEGQIIQFNNKLGDLRETLGNGLYPAVLNFYAAMTEHFPQIEQIMIGISNACSVLIEVLTWIATLAIDAATAISDNWGWLGPIILGVAGAYLILQGAILAYNTVQTISNGIKAFAAFQAKAHAAAEAMEAGATFGATAAQYGLNAALYACPLVWIIMLVIALIALFYAAVGAINKFAGTSISATGLICGAFMAALAFIGNIFVALWNLVVDVFVLIYNLVADVANFIGNVFNDPVGAVCRLFFDLADTVLGVLQALASAIDAIFGSDLAGSVQGWRDSLGGWVDETFGKGEEVMEHMNADDLKLGRFEYGAAFDLGYNFGEGIEDKVSGMFDFSNMGLGMDNLDAFNLGNTLDGIYGNTGDTAANTAASAEALEYTEEDLQYLKDIAEREAINRFTTAEITVEQTNHNTITPDTDLDGITDMWAADFAEKLEVSREGVD